MKLENKQIGVFTGLIFAFLLLVMPNADKSKYTFKPDLLAKSILDNEDHISPEDLSQWIIEGRNDFYLIDIRSEEEFNKSHIKDSNNIPILKLLKKETIDTELPENKIVVLYSNGNSHAHQVWLILKSAGADVYVLEGGFNRWNKIIMNPSLPVDYSDDEVLRYNAASSVAKYFGGGSTEVSTTEKSVKKKKKIIRRKKKKLEGC